MKGLFIIMSLGGALLVTGCDGGTGHRYPLKKSLGNRDAKLSASGKAVNDEVAKDTKCLRVDALLNKIAELKEQTVIINVTNKNLGELKITEGKSGDMQFTGKASTEIRAHAFLSQAESELLWTVAAKNIRGDSLPEQVLNKLTLDAECKTLTLNGDAKQPYQVLFADRRSLLVRKTSDPKTLIEYRYNGDGRLLVSTFNPGAPVCGQVFETVLRSYSVDFASASPLLQIDTVFAQSLTSSKELPVPAELALNDGSKNGRTLSTSPVATTTLLHLQLAMSAEGFQGPACPAAK